MKRRTDRNILVTSAFGQIGSELVPVLRQGYGDEQLIASDLRMAPGTAIAAAGRHEHLDCTEISQLLEAVRRHNIGTIYHLAAMLSAAAEAMPQIAWSLNMGSLYNVLEVARQYGCNVLFPMAPVAGRPVEQAGLAHRIVATFPFVEADPVEAFAAASFCDVAELPSEFDHSETAFSLGVASLV